MGYSVDITLHNVKLAVLDWPEILDMFRDWNREYLIPNRDWMRFDSSLKSPVEVFEDMRYEAKEVDGFIEILEFVGEKLGSDCILFEKLAPYLIDDCEIKYCGEDGVIWNQFIWGGKVRRRRRPKKTKKQLSLPENFGSELDKIDKSN